MHEPEPLPLATLEGTHVRLEPLTLAHVPAMVAAATEDRATYAYTWVPDSEPSMRGYVQVALAEQEAGRTRPFVTVRRSDGLIIGCTRFGNIDHWPWEESNPNRRVVDSVEIGWTWLAASAQRTPVNTEAKYLMLTHAFEKWRCHRVQLTTDERNLRSRNAIQRIGAQFEGVLRANRPGSDGVVRSTAFFSIVEADWPGVKAMLEAKLPPVASGLQGGSMTRVLVQSLPDYNFAQVLTAEGHAHIADEPVDDGGNGLGPTPYELLTWALGACTSMTIQMYARRKKYPLHEVAVQVEHERVHAKDSAGANEGQGRMEVLRRKIVLRGPLSEEQRADLLRVAGKCPVHKTLLSAPEIIDELEVV